jgi:NAD(P)-dependent dehydrogenase (short-subunit alcohol dehydrogenase family)
MSAESDVQLTDFASLFSLSGKVAVVTGGSRGLGLHAASGLLQAGCSKVFITSRKASACAAAAAALNALPNLAPGARAYSVPADSSQVAEIERLVREVATHTDHVDVLFANAGASWGSRFEDVDERNAWDKVMDLNVKAVFFTIQKCVAALRPRCWCVLWGGVLADALQVRASPRCQGLRTRLLARHRDGQRRWHWNRFSRRQRRVFVRREQGRGHASRAQPGD